TALMNDRHCKIAAMGRASIAVTGLMIATVAQAPSSGAVQRPERSSTTYRDAVLAYRRGDFDSAANALAGQPPVELRRAVAEFVLRNRDWQLLAAASMLHIDLILHGNVTRDAPFHIALSQSIVDDLGTAPPAPIAAFQVRWYALAGSIYLARTEPGKASG